MNATRLEQTAHVYDVPPAVAADGELPPLTVEPVEKSVTETRADSSLGLVELLLKDPERVDTLNREEHRAPVLIPRFLGIGLASYLLFSLALVLILNTVPADAYPHRLLPIPDARWSEGPAAETWPHHVVRTAAPAIAYTVGLVAATCLCLPSFYFFGLLAGVRLSMLQVVAHVLRSKASGAIVLIGILPIYVAVAMGLIVFQAPAPVLETCLDVGLVLPFLAGFEVLRCIYRGVLGLAQTMPPERRCRRACFLRRLSVSWAACYMAVSPVMIYRLWEVLSGPLT